MKRTPPLVAATMLAATLLTATGPATASNGAPAPVDAATGTRVERIVVLDPSQAAQLAPPAQRGKALGRVRVQQSVLQSAARSVGVDMRTTYSYQHVLNGVAVTVPADQVDELTRLPGVTMVVEPQHFDPPTPIPRLPAPAHQRAMADVTELGRETVTVGNLTGVPEAHQRHFDGAGVTIGILDSGVAWDLPAFGGGTFPNSRVIGGYDFADDDPDPYDDNSSGAAGHGTHVAGIALGNDEHMTGVAPAAKLRAYRVFNEEGASEQTLLAALDRAAADRVDVINMSLGQTGLRSTSTIGLAVDQVSDSGIPVVVAVGNGRAGPFSAGAPAVARSAIAVGSVYGERRSWLGFTLNDGSDEPIPYQVGSLNAVTPASGTYPVVELTGACAALPPGSLDGKIAIFGTMPGFECRGMDQARVAEAAGAEGALYYDTFDEHGMPYGICCRPEVAIPIAMVRQPDARRILAASDPRITWGAYVAEEQAETAKGRTSVLSSWGPGNELEFKPDVVAPGDSIFSTVPSKLGYYAHNSGTSMAAPHVTGIVALLRQADPALTPEQTVAVLANSAVPSSLTGGSAQQLHPTAQQGAGLVNAAAALDILQDRSPTVTPSRLAIGDLEGRRAVRQLQVSNPGDRPVTYRVRHRASVSAAPPYTSSWESIAASATVSTSKDLITIRPGSISRMNVMVQEPAGVAAGTLLGGWIELQPVSSTLPTIRVPYQAVSGDFDAVSAINPTFGEFNPELDNPALRPADFSFGKSAPITVNLTDADTDNDSAWVMVSHGFPLLQRFRLQVLNAKNKVVATPVDRPWEPRNSGAGTGMEFLTWDAMLPSRTAAPSGTYRLRLVFDKALGDADGAPAQQTWTSPEVTLIS